MTIRTYSELSKLKTFEERFEYLKLGGKPFDVTFGFERFLNQRFYQSYEWKKARRDTIARDLGLDLGVKGYDIHDNIIVHHMNPIRPEDIEDFNRDIVDPEFLITTRLSTHNAIHYGDSNHLILGHVERKPGDTKLW